MSFHRQHPCPPSCWFSLPSFTSSRHKLRLNVFFARVARNYARCARVIPKLRTPFRQQHPYPPLCRLSSKSDNSSNQKLRISAFWRASRAIMRAACARSQIRQSQFFGTPSLSAHAKFRPNPSLLAATLFCKTANSCEPPTKLQSFYCGPYGPKLFSSFHQLMRALYRQSLQPDEKSAAALKNKIQ